MIKHADSFLSHYIFHSLSIQLGLYCTSIVMLHVGSTFFISTLCLFSHYFTISFYALYIVDHMYTHVNLTLVYKTAKIRQGTPFAFSCCFP